MTAPLDRARAALADMLDGGLVDSTMHAQAVKVLDGLDAVPANTAGLCVGCGAILSRPSGRGRPSVACADCRGIVRRVRDAERHARARHVERIAEALDAPTPAPVAARILRENPDVGGAVDNVTYCYTVGELRNSGFTVDRAEKRAPLPGHSSPAGPWIGSTLKRGTDLYGVIYGDGGLRAQACEHPWWASSNFADGERRQSHEGGLSLARGIDPRCLTDARTSRGVDAASSVTPNQTERRNDE